jgi:predicted helicase
MTALSTLLDTFRQASVSEREKGTYFEELTACYLCYEATYRDLYSEVWTYAGWANQQGFDKRDTGIDLVANPRYPLEPFQHVVIVSLETMKIVKSLPLLNI